jgi:zinc protease
MTAANAGGSRSLRLALAAILPAVCVYVAAAQQLPPRPSAESPVAATLPVPAVLVLPNGVRVVLIERHSAPIVSLSAMIMAGAERDPAGEAGTAEMVAGLLTEGTEKRSALDIAQAVDQAGGTIDSGADWDKSLVSVTVLSDQRPLAFDLLSDILIHPAFRPAEIERFRKQTISALQVLWQDPSFVADAAIRRLVFNGTPYAHPADGTIASNSRISRTELEKFHATYYTPDNTILAVLGDISSEEGFRLATKYFGHWQGGEKPAPPTAAASEEPPPERVLVIDKPDAVQTEIRVGEPGIPRSSADFYALTVANQILGGPAANRLFQTLRTDRGLVYGASSELACYRNAGAWIAKTSTRTEETAKALEVVLEEMNRLGRHPVTYSELGMARNYLAGNQALEFESMDGIAVHTLERLLYGLPLDYWNKFSEEIDRLSTNGIESVVAPYLQPNRDAIVLVGNSSEFARHLKKIGPVKIIPIDDLDIASPSLERRQKQGTHP